MHQTSPEPADQFAAVLDRLPADLDIEALARTTKAFTRARGVRPGMDLLRLARAWACGGHSVQPIAAWAGETGIATMTNEALVQRLHRSVPFLEGLNRALLDNTAGMPCRHGRTLRIADSSSLSQQASHGTDWRIYGVFDFGQGRFSHLELTDSHGGEALDRGGAVAGEVRIGDRNYANAPPWRRFQAAHQAQNPAITADFIVRMRWNTVRLVDTAGARFDIIAWLQTRPADGGTDEIAVLACAGKQAPAADPPHHPAQIARGDNQGAQGPAPAGQP